MRLSAGFPSFKLSQVKLFNFNRSTFRGLVYWVYCQAVMQSTLRNQSRFLLCHMPWDDGRFVLEDELDSLLYDLGRMVRFNSSIPRVPE